MLRKTVLLVSFFVLIVCNDVMPRPSKTESARKSRNRRLIKGRNASFDDWGFMVNLNFLVPIEWKICGGALIDKHWVLTAAHCVESLYKNPQHVTVTVGRAKRSTSEDPSRTYKVDKIVIYKSYLEQIMGNWNASAEYFNWDYDIALLKLKKPVQHNVTIAKLPPKSLKVSEAANVRCRAAGWGSQKRFDDSRPVWKQAYEIPEHLQEIDVPLRSRGECRKVHHKKEITDLIFCGGVHKKGTTSTCVGDSGSPLACHIGYSKTPVVAGITVGGNSHCQTGKEYMIFTDVARYRPWIEHYINC